MSIIRKRKPLSYYADHQEVARNTHANIILAGLAIIFIGFFAKIVFL
ncbi:MAG: hypothetical protein R3B47_11940 [Bacteroidia bacterium]